MTIPGNFTPGDVLTAADMNGLPAGAITRAAVTSAQTGITTVVDLTSLTVTWTASSSRLYRISWKLMLTSTAAGDLMATYLTNASNTQVQRWLMTSSALSGGVSYQSVTGTHYETGLSGSTTRKLRLERNTGSGTLASQATATEAAFLVVEDIGPA